jgi:hypothetical protein
LLFENPRPWIAPAASSDAIGSQEWSAFVSNEFHKSSILLLAMNEGDYQILH